MVVSVRSSFVEGIGRAAGIDYPEMVRPLVMDIVVDAQPVGSLAEAVVPHTVEDSAFVGADKDHDFVQGPEGGPYVDLVGSLHAQATVDFVNLRIDLIELWPHL